MTTENIYDILCINKPVSIIRCGDGEKIVLDGFSNFGKFNSVLKRQLGYSPSISDADEIRDNLISAISNADIVGVPMHKKLDQMHQDWKDVEKTIDKYCVTPKRRCSLDIHYDFLNGGYFKKLLTNLPELNYVSCRDLDKAFQFNFKIQVTNQYQIAPEAKFTTYEGDPHYPYQFNRIQKWMDKVRPDNKILLVGAGFVGKIYCNWWRDRGGRAFDIGSVFDEWAGRVTRGPDRELDKIEKGQHYLHEN